MSDKHVSDQASQDNKWKKFVEGKSNDGTEVKVNKANKDDEATAEAEDVVAQSNDELSHSQCDNNGLEFPDRSKLEAQLTKMEQEVDAYKDKHLRLLAQMKNIQERSERDVANAHKFGSERLIGDLLPVIDSLTRGLETCKGDNTETRAVREGMQLTLELLIKTLKKHGVAEINPNAGEAFDPAIHEAVSMQPITEGAKANTVSTVMQQGYSLNGRVLRAAMVIVFG